MPGDAAVQRSESRIGDGKGDRDIIIHRLRCCISRLIGHMHEPLSLSFHLMTLLNYSISSREMQTILYFIHP